MTHRPAHTIILALIVALGVVALPSAAGAAPSFVDTQVKANLLLLRGYIDEYAIGNSFTYPPVAVVKKGGGLVAPVWPANPWTGRTMVPGTTRGTYTYRVSATGYALIGHLSKGTYKLTGSVPTWMKVSPNLEAKVGVTLLATYIDQFMSDNGGQSPVPGQVTSLGAVGIGVPIWPVNPWTGGAMTSGSAPGQFSYAQNGASYTLSVNLAGASSWTVPGH
jgi:hypothetical protein